MNQEKAIMNWMGILSALIIFSISIIQYATNPSLSARSIILLIVLCVIILGISLWNAQKQERERKASSFKGKLKPDSNILLSIKDKKLPLLEIGDSGVVFKWTGPNDQPLLHMFEDTSLIISTDKGQIKISTKIRDKDGLVAEIENNEWKVNPYQAFDRNYNKNTLEIKDRNGDIILQVAILNNRIQFQGIFYNRYGKGVALVGQKAWGGCVIEQTGYDRPKLDSTIEPIFGFHFGEVRRIPERSAMVTTYTIGEPKLPMI